MKLMVEKPNRIKHRYIQTIKGTPDVVFPLLCPVLEVEWVPDWLPKLVISKSGFAEEACIFVTPSEPHDAIWIVTKHDPENHFVEMYKITPGHTVAKLEATVLAAGNGTSKVAISYEFTATGPSGHDFLKTFTADWYEKFMIDWEAAMNRYLAKTGSQK